MLLIILQEKLTLLQAKERPLALTAAQFSSVSYITFEYSFEADDALNIPSGQNENVNRLNCVSKLHGKYDLCNRRKTLSRTSNE